MYRFALFAGALCLVSAPAQAAGDSAGTSSSGSARVTVYIPPVASAIAASEAGAVGLWSISGQHDGIMIDLNAPEGFMQSVDIYSRQTSGIEFNWDAAGDFFQTSPQTGSDDLVRSHFAVPQNMPLVSTFTVRAI